MAIGFGHVINELNYDGWSLINKEFLEWLNYCLNQKRIPRSSFVITSGFRTQADQERLKKQGYEVAENSLHLTGQAMDIVFDTFYNPYYFSDCRNIRSIYYPTTNHWHFQINKGGSPQLIPIGISETGNIWHYALFAIAAYFVFSRIFK